MNGSNNFFQNTPHNVQASCTSKSKKIVTSNVQLLSIVIVENLDPHSSMGKIVNYNFLI